MICKKCGRPHTLGGICWAEWAENIAKDLKAKKKTLAIKKRCD